MRKKMIAGNWKMNGSESMIRDLIAGIVKGRSEGIGAAAEMTVFPPFPYLALVKELLQGTGMTWGGQNINPHSSGAHTGEVAGSMLQEFGCHYVLTGHSERRALYGESNAQVAARFEGALNAGLVPVLCVGETLEQRQSGATMEVVGGQIDAVLDVTGVGGFEHAILAYEPVWAIGTGHTASPEQAQEIHAAIRGKFLALDGTIGDSLRILYGGSVNGSNAADLFARDDIDGGLVGGASLTAEDFLAICRCVI